MQGMSVFISHVGSPVVLVEKLLSGTETSTALKGMMKLLSSGVLDETNDFGRKSDGGLEVKQFAKYPGVYEATGLENIKSLKNSDIPLVSTCFSHVFNSQIYVPVIFIIIE